MDSASAYEKYAHEFLRGRDRSPIGTEVVHQWAHTLTKGAEIIELACGGGYPVTRELVNAGLRLWAIDSSPTLVSEFQARFPEIPVRCEKVQDSDFFARRFDAAVAVGLIFLLPEPQQAALIARIGNLLTPGGRCLLTAPRINWGQITIFSNNRKYCDLTPIFEACRGVQFPVHR